MKSVYETERDIKQITNDQYKDLSHKTMKKMFSQRNDLSHAERMEKEKMDKVL